MGDITCSTVNQFVDVLARLVSHGLRFEADADTLTIKLTGGY